MARQDPKEHQDFRALQEYPGRRVPLVTPGRKAPQESLDVRETRAPSGRRDRRVPRATRGCRASQVPPGPWALRGSAGRGGRPGPWGCRVPRARGGPLGLQGPRAQKGTGAPRASGVPRDTGASPGCRVYLVERGHRETRGPSDILAHREAQVPPAPAVPPGGTVPRDPRALWAAPDPGDPRGKLANRAPPATLDPPAHLVAQENPLATTLLPCMPSWARAK